MKIIIVGAVAGGASAAARARRLDEDAEIILVERGEAPSFANCGLPYYVGGVIESRDKLLVTPQQRLIDRYRLDVRTHTEALRIDSHAKIVFLRDLQTGNEYSESYDKLILSPGASPLRPPIPGVDLPQVYTLRDLGDADRLSQAASQAEQAVVIGAGFIGLEMTENLVRRGIETTVVELADQILPPWDAEMVSIVAEHLRSKGVKLELADAAEAIIPVGDRLLIQLRSGKQLPADLVVLSVGVRPENKLAIEAGLEVGQRGGIRVNEQMQTSDPDIYAVGDAVEVHHFVDGTPVQIPLGGPANRQGRIAADSIFGRSARYRGTQGTAVVGVFDMTASMTGLSEKSLRAAGMAFEKIYVHPSHHAGYFPGAEQMSLKLLFVPKDGKILGAQAVGRAGVDKRMLEQMTGSAFVERRRSDMTATFDRHARLSADLAAMRDAGPFERPFQMTRPDRKIARAAWQDFQPAIPITFEGVVFACTGFIAGAGLAWSLAGLIRLLTRPRRALT